MKANTNLLLMAFGLFMAWLSSCTRPDRVNDESEFCNTGQSVLTIDDGAITSAVKNIIYKPFAGSGIISTDNPKYNHTGRTIIIPFTFTDLPWNTAVTTDVINSSYFGLDNGSYNDYFLENSYGQFGLTKVAIAAAPVNVPHTLSDWQDVPSAPSHITTADLLKYICQNAVVPWNLADVNGDHNITPDEVQVVFVYSAGLGGICRPNTFSFSTNFGGAFTIENRFGVIDCKRNDAPDRSVKPILDNSTACHELGHCFFGLPDRYGSSGICATGVTGPYDIMADNCSWKHFSIYDKMKIGWLRPRILDVPENRPDHARHCYEFPASETTPAAVVLYTGSTPDEFYIIENRYAPSASFGFESGFRENGLAVWWASTTSDAIRLVSFKHWGRIPTTYNYDDVAEHDGAMFVNKHDYGATVPIVLRNSNNVAYFSFRAISPAGAVMHAEL